MNVVAADKYMVAAEIEVSLFNGTSLKVSIETTSIESVLEQSDLSACTFLHKKIM